jgi:hypothetical protein
MLAMFCRKRLRNELCVNVNILKCNCFNVLIKHCGGLSKQRLFHLVNLLLLIHLSHYVYIFTPILVEQIFDYCKQIYLY